MIKIIQTNPDSIIQKWYEEYQYVFIINFKLRLESGDQSNQKYKNLSEEFEIMEVT